MQADGSLLEPRGELGFNGFGNRARANTYRRQAAEQPGKERSELYQHRQ